MLPCYSSWFKWTNEGKVIALWVIVRLRILGSAQYEASHCGAGGLIKPMPGVFAHVSQWHEAAKTIIANGRLIQPLA